MNIKIVAFYLLFILGLILPSTAHAQLPPAPQGAHVWCLTGQAAVRLNWFPVEGATSYQVRLDGDAPSWSGTCSSPDACLSTNTSEITIPISPNKPYDWWVHSVNGKGWSDPAMPGNAFTCTIPPPTGLHYQCMPDNTVTLNWIPNNPAQLYELTLNNAAPIPIQGNSVNLPITRSSDSEFTVRAVDTKGNKSVPSTSIVFNCGSTNVLTPIPTSSMTTPTPPVSPAADVSPTPEPTIDTNDICTRRTEGDANCDGIINIDDSECWKKVFTINFLEVSRGCKYTNFDESDGTNILDFVIWYAHREA